MLFPRLCGLVVLPMMPHLHFSRSIAISDLSPISFISPSNRALQVILGLPLPLLPATSEFLQVLTQSWILYNVYSKIPHSGTSFAAQVPVMQWFSHKSNLGCPPAQPSTTTTRPSTSRQCWLGSARVTGELNSPK